MPRYIVYGLTVEVNAALRGLADAADLPVDIVVRLQEQSPFERPLVPSFVSPGRDERGIPAIVVSRSDGAWRVEYADGTAFDVSDDSTRVWAAWPSGLLTVDDAAVYLLGPILSLALRLRGTLALHAGAAGVDGRAVAFCGDAGVGKSSLVAAFAAAGHAAVSDDVVAVGGLPDAPVTWSSYEYLRLWPEAAEALFGANHGLPRLTPGWDKLALPLAERGLQFVRGEAPLTAVFVMDEGDRPAIESLTPTDAVIALVANTSVNYMLDGPRRRTELAQLGDLVHAVPVRRLRVPRDYARLGDVVSLVADAVRR